jgi:pantothenate kinase
VKIPSIFKSFLAAARGRWFVDVAPATALDRLVERHLKAGIETTEEAAAARALENDIPNGKLICELLIEPQIRIVN